MFVLRSLNRNFNESTAKSKLTTLRTFIPELLQLSAFGTVVGSIFSFGLWCFGYGAIDLPTSIQGLMIDIFMAALVLVAFGLLLMTRDLVSGFKVIAAVSAVSAYILMLMPFLSTSTLSRPNQIFVFSSILAATGIAVFASCTVFLILDFVGNRTSRQVNLP